MFEVKEGLPAKMWKYSGHRINHPTMQIKCTGQNHTISFLIKAFFFNIVFFSIRWVVSQCKTLKLPKKRKIKLNNKWLVVEMKKLFKYLMEPRDKEPAKRKTLYKVLYHTL